LRIKALASSVEGLFSDWFRHPAPDSDHQQPTSGADPHLSRIRQGLANFL